MPSISSIDRELAKSSLPLLIQILHEHTTDDIREEQTLRQFTTKFLSDPQVKRRFRASQILHTIVENTEVSTILETLRSIIEDLYKQSSDPQFRSTIPFDDVIGQLVSVLREFLYRAYHMVYTSTNFDTFQRLGGVFVLLDLLFLDHRLFQNMSHQWSKLREVSILLIDRLIYYVDDVKKLFIRSKPLLALLTQIYRRYSNWIIDENSSLIKNTIANSFKTLVKFDRRHWREFHADFQESRIVEYLTENAIKWNKTKDNDTELVATLEAISVMTKCNMDCRYDFLAVDGSMDLLIDVFEHNRQPDWNWTWCYWTNDLMSDKGSDPADEPLLGYLILLFFFGSSNFTFNKVVALIFWILPFKKFQEGFNYYRAKFSLSRPNLGPACVCLAIRTAILIKYLLWFGTILLCFTSLRDLVPKVIVSWQETYNFCSFLILAIPHVAQLSFKPPRKLWGAGNIIENLGSRPYGVLDSSPGAVWRFRQRDAYQILTRYLYIWVLNRRFHLEALQTIQNHQLGRPETKAERRRVKKYQTARKVGMIKRCMNASTHYLRRAWVIFTFWCVP